MSGLSHESFSRPDDKVGNPAWCLLELLLGAQVVGVAAAEDGNIHVYVEQIKRKYNKYSSVLIKSADTLISAVSKAPNRHNYLIQRIEIFYST